MSRSTNVAGKTYALMVLTPIRPGLEDSLRAYLEGLAEASPFERVSRTHFARFLIVPDMPAPPGLGVEDPLDGPYLMFTANFDGDLESWLRELCDQLDEAAEEIWGKCIGCPSPASGAALKAYLWRNQLQSGVVFAAYGNASVEQIRRALEKRARLGDFVIRAQDMEPAERRKAFLKEFGS